MKVVKYSLTFFLFFLTANLTFADSIETNIDLSAENGIALSRDSNTQLVVLDAQNGGANADAMIERDVGHVQFAMNDQPDLSDLNNPPVSLPSENDSVVADTTTTSANGMQAVSPHADAGNLSPVDSTAVSEGTDVKAASTESVQAVTPHVDTGNSPPLNSEAAAVNVPNIDNTKPITPNSDIHVSSTDEMAPVLPASKDEAARNVNNDPSVVPENKVVPLDASAVSVAVVPVAKNSKPKVIAPPKKISTTPVAPKPKVKANPVKAKIQNKKPKIAPAKMNSTQKKQAGHIVPATKTGRFEVSAGVGMNWANSDNTKLVVSPSETDSLKKKHTANAAVWKLGVGYYLFDDVQRSVFNQFLVELNLYENSSTIVGNVWQYESVTFNNYRFRAPFNSIRLMVDAKPTIFSFDKHRISLYPIIGAGVTRNQMKYYEDVTASGVSLDSAQRLGTRTKAAFAYDLGAGIRFALTDRIGLSLEYLYTDLGDMKPSGVSQKNVAITSPPRFSVHNQSVLLSVNMKT